MEKIDLTKCYEELDECIKKTITLRPLIYQLKFEIFSQTKKKP